MFERTAPVPARAGHGLAGLDKGPSRAWGFTLVEILIVIAVLGILASLALTTIPMIRRSGDVAGTTIDINNLANAIEHYDQDEGEYPGEKAAIQGDGNQFPLLFDALFGKRRPNGPGGRSAPYMNLKVDRIVVYDEDSGAYRPATRAEIYNPKVKKFILDAWGNPLVYRVNKGRPLELYMYNRHGFDLYSTGPDGVDQTFQVEDAGDDIGNW